MAPSPVSSFGREQEYASDQTRIPATVPANADAFLQMKQAKNINLNKRAVVKMASRRVDRQRLENGESQEAIQRENSIFPPDYFKQHRILNFASAIGR